MQKLRLALIIELTKKMISENDVRNAYMVLLGRPPEPGWEPAGWVELERDVICGNLLKSPEFEDSIARPMLAGLSAENRWRTSLTAEIRTWSIDFFGLSAASRSAISVSGDWDELLSALLRDQGFANRLGHHRDWTWAQLAHQFGSVDSASEPNAIVAELIGRAASGVRLVQFASLQPAGRNCVKFATSDPWFLFELDPEAKSGKICVLNFSARLSHANANSKVYVDYGDGFSEPDAFALSAAVSSVVLANPDRVRYIRWDPADVAGGTMILQKVEARAASTSETYLFEALESTKATRPVDTSHALSALYAKSILDSQRRSPEDEALFAFISALIDKGSSLLNLLWLSRYGFRIEQGVDALLSLGRYADFRGSPYFDKEWYAQQVPAMARKDYFSAFMDYLKRGQFIGLTPNPFFVSELYIAAHADVGQAVREGRIHSPLEHLAASDGHEDRAMAFAFDQHFYRSQGALALEGVDPEQFGVKPFAHYIIVGWREGRRPNAVFDADWFDAHAPAGPGTLTYPNAYSRFVNGGPNAKRHISPFFDVDVYLTNSPDVAKLAATAKGFDPFVHYLRAGRREARVSDKHDVGTRINPYFPKALPDMRDRVSDMAARDALCSLGGPTPAMEDIGEAVWRFGEGICSVRYGGDIVAFSGQAITFYISGEASLPQARLVDVRLDNTGFLGGHSFLTYPVLNDVVALTALSGEKLEDSGYCAWFEADLCDIAPGRYQLPVKFVFERGGLRRTIDGPALTLRVNEAPQAVDVDGGVQVLMASYNPPRGPFEHQIRTILDQQTSATSDGAVSILISDDASPPQGARAVMDATQDSRVRVSLSQRNMGFVQNFERTLLMRSPQAEAFLFSDQDDSWYPHKVARLTSELRDDVVCSYSDMRVVDGDGNVISPTFWDTRRAHHTDPLSLSIANAMTGAAAAFTPAVAAALTPFPHYMGIYHDQWLAVLATAMGRVSYVEEPLYDYIQHGENVLGFAGSRETSTGKWRAIRNTLRRAAHRTSPQAWDEREIAALRSADLIIPEIIQRFVMLREALGRVERWHDEGVQTLARDLVALFAGDTVDLRAMATSWGKLKRVSGGNLATIGIDYRMEAVLVAIYCMRRMPGLLARVADQKSRELQAQSAFVARSLDVGQSDFAKKTAAIPAARHGVSATAPMRVNLFLPELNPKTFFGGYHSKISLVSRLVERGIAVRLILVDEASPNYMAISDIGGAFPELIPALQKVEIVAAGARDRPLSFGANDALLATTWWSAGMVDSIRSLLGQQRFTYFIQEFEPFTFNMGTWYRGAELTYSLPHAGVYSTDILRQYFVAGRHGQFADSTESATPWLSFENPITGLDGFQRTPIAERPRRILFYARPQPHAARNMYEFGVEALRAAVVELGSALDGWQIIGVGADEPAKVDLGGGRFLQLYRKFDAYTYRRTLAGSDVGLALMYTPHPSLVPIEMVAAGLVTVTNECMTKDAATMAEISPDLIVADADIPGIAKAIVSAVRRTLAEDYAAKPVSWPTNPKEAFPDVWMDSFLDILRGSLAPPVIEDAPADDAHQAGGSRRSLVGRVMKRRR